MRKGIKIMLREAPYMTFDVKNYTSEQLMMVDVGMVMAAQTRNGYECLFRYEDCGIYVLEFLNGDKSLGADRFMVVSPEEEEMVYDSRDNDLEEKLNDLTNEESPATSNSHTDTSPAVVPLDPVRKEQ